MSLVVPWGGLVTAGVRELRNFFSWLHTDKNNEVPVSERTRNAFHKTWKDPGVFQGLVSSRVVSEQLNPVHPSFGGHINIVSAC